MIVHQNPNLEEREEIIAAVRANGGFCPCSSEKTADTCCPCREFLNSENVEFCHCGLYYKLPEQIEMLALVGNVTYGADEFDQWENILNKQNFIIIPIKFNSRNVYHHSDDYSNLCRTKIALADAVLMLDEETNWALDLETWSNAICKRVLHRSDLR